MGCLTLHAMQLLKTDKSSAHGTPFAWSTASVSIGQVVRTWNSVCMVHSKRQHRPHPIPHATLSISSACTCVAFPRERSDHLFQCRLLSGLGAAAVELDACAALALLDAFQRQGWFRAAGEARTMVELRAGCVAAYARFLPEAVGILQTAGGPAQHHMCPMWYTLHKPQSHWHYM